MLDFVESCLKFALFFSLTVIKVMIPTVVIKIYCVTKDMMIQKKLMKLLKKMMMIGTETSKNS